MASSISSDNLLIKGLFGKYHIFEKEFAIEEDGEQERPITIVMVRKENGGISLYVKGEKACQTYLECINSYEDLFQIKVGNKTIPGAMYQAFLVYNRALAVNEVEELFDALSLMYE